MADPPDMNRWISRRPSSTRQIDRNGQQHRKPDDEASRELILNVKVARLRAGSYGWFPVAIILEETFSSPWDVPSRDLSAMSVSASSFSATIPYQAPSSRRIRAARLERTNALSVPEEGHARTRGGFSCARGKGGERPVGAWSSWGS